MARGMVCRQEFGEDEGHRKEAVEEDLKVPQSVLTMFTADKIPKYGMCKVE